LRQRPGAALVGRGQGFVAPAFFDQQVNVAVVDIRGVGGEGQREPSCLSCASADSKAFSAAL